MIQNYFYQLGGRWVWTEQNQRFSSFGMLLAFDVLCYCACLLLPCHRQNISGSQHPALPIVSGNKGLCVFKNKKHKFTYSVI